MCGWRKKRFQGCPKLALFMEQINQPFTSPFCPCQGMKQGWNDSLVLPSPSIIWYPVLGTGNLPSPLYLAEAHGCGEVALWEAWAGLQVLDSMTGVFGAVKEYLECASCGHCGLLHTPDLYSASHQPSKSGGVVSDCLSLSCFSCLNSSTDSLPTCFCSAGYTGNGTHCTGMSSKDKVK